MEDNNNNNVSAAKFAEWRWHAKEKKAAEEQRWLETEPEPKRKVEEKVRRKVVEQEWLRVAQEVYLKKMEEEAQKCKKAKEEAKKQISGDCLRADTC